MYLYTLLAIKSTKLGYSTCGKIRPHVEYPIKWVDWKSISMLKAFQLSERPSMHSQRLLSTLSAFVLFVFTLTQPYATPYQDPCNAERDGTTIRLKTELAVSHNKNSSLTREKQALLQERALLRRKLENKETQLKKVENYLSQLKVFTIIGAAMIFGVTAQITQHHIASKCAAYR